MYYQIPKLLISNKNLHYPKHCLKGLKFLYQNLQTSKFTKHNVQILFPNYKNSKKVLLQFNTFLNHSLTNIVHHHLQGCDQEKVFLFKTYLVFNTMHFLNIYSLLLLQHYQENRYIELKGFLISMIQNLKHLHHPY